MLLFQELRNKESERCRGLVRARVRACVGTPERDLEVGDVELEIETKSPVSPAPRFARVLIDSRELHRMVKLLVLGGALDLHQIVTMELDASVTRTLDGDPSELSKAFGDGALDLYRLGGGGVAWPQAGSTTPEQVVEDIVRHHAGVGFFVGFFAGKGGAR